nr:MAG TPA: hypothetical protein [Caudoviricetes sp.]
MAETQSKYHVARLELIDGELLLDGNVLPTVESYEIKTLDAGMAELTVKMAVDVTSKTTD